MKGLERDLSKRYKSVDEFAKAFCTAVREETPKTHWLPHRALPQRQHVTDPESLRGLLMERSVRRGDFVLASGKRSSYYIDCRLATMSAAGMVLIGRLGLSSDQGRRVAAGGSRRPDHGG